MTVRHDHAQAVDADTQTCRRRHAELERAQEIFVELHGFFVATLAELELVLEALALVGSLSSEKALQISLPLQIASKRSTSPGLSGAASQADSSPADSR